MKWKGRRQSTNVEDMRNAPRDEIADMIAAYDTYTGGKSPEAKAPKHTTKEIEVAKELGKYNREKRNPIPTPRPLNVIKTQVTPGKWETKNK